MIRANDSGLAAGPPAVVDEPARKGFMTPRNLIIVVGALAWILVANTYGSLPQIPWLPAFTIFALAAFEAVLARNTKARIDRKPNTAPVDVLAVARYVVLAKASSPAAAIFSGLYGGILIWLLFVRFVVPETKVNASLYSPNI